MPSQTGYSRAQIVLHWTIAAGVLFNYIASDGLGRALRQQQAGEAVTVQIAGPHVWAGVVLVMLVLLRLALRARHGAPSVEPGWRGLVARVTHGALYALILLVPVLGGLAWFAGLPTGGPHGGLANLLMIVAALHVLAALYHQVVLKDGIMRRMLHPS